MNRCVLALESGGTTASVALMDAQGGLRFACAESGQSHSSQLLPMAQELLDQAGIGWSTLDGLAVGIGPGSFTGLRIACGVAQGLALGSQKKLLGVSSFEAWAYAWWRTRGMHLAASDQDVTRLQMSFDARLGERFHAVLGLKPQDDRLDLQWLEQPSVVPQRVACEASDGSLVLMDPDMQSFSEQLPLAAWMAKMACDEALEHARHWVQPSELRPLYVRDKVAATIEEREANKDLQWSPMSIDDISSVMEIEQQAYPFPWTAGNFADSLRAGYDMQVLRERGVMIGYVVWMRVLREAHLLNIALSPARQRRGLGAWMMRQFLARLAGSDMDLVLLEVRPSNHAALALYRKFGFAQIGVRKGYYPNHAGEPRANAHAREDALVMSLGIATTHVHEHAHARSPATSGAARD